jgi:signal peptidase
MQMPRKVKKVWDIVTTTLVVLVVLFAIFLMGSRLLGLQVYHVISPSMEPNYSVGDLIYVKTVDPDSVKVGDPITFVLNEDLVVATHRVVAIDSENRQFTTKGDANKEEDPAPTSYYFAKGRVDFSIPLVGYIAQFLNSVVGKVVLCAVYLAWIAVEIEMFIMKRKASQED